MLLKILTTIPGLLKLIDMGKALYSAIQKDLERRRELKHQAAIKKAEQAKSKDDIRDAIDDLTRNP